MHALENRLQRALPPGLATSVGVAFASEMAGPPTQPFELADKRLYTDKLPRAA